jgi:hypothetical protein
MAMISALGLEDMSTHFRQRQQFWHGNTWQMEREGNIIRSKCDYILGTNRRMFDYINFSTRPSRRRVFWWNQPLANTHLLTQDDTITDTPT